VGVFRPFPTLLCPANSSQFYLLAKNLGPNLYPRKNPVVAPVHWPESAYAVGRVGNDGVANGERQIEIASRGADVVEDARAD